MQPLTSVLRYLWEVGQYDEALKLLDQTESICAQTVGLHSLEAARIYVNRGSVFSTLNRYDEAGKLFKRGLQIRSALLPENSSLLANSYMQMGNYFTSQGQVEDAVRAHRQVIGIREKAPETPSGIMIISYFNICRSLLMGNRVDEAEAYLRRAEGLEPQLEQGREAFSYRSQSVNILPISLFDSDCLLTEGAVVASIFLETSCRLVGRSAQLIRSMWVRTKRE
jgi:tetratricopeptide (TPR) repeat protein